jgi:uncharacterized protein YgiM (DUF1202 family)
MKKILIILAMSMITFLFSLELEVVQAANVRTKPISFKDSTIVGSVMPGMKLVVTDTYSDSYKVKCVSGTDHVGKTGYMWAKRIQKTENNNAEIIIEGCSLRAGPSKKSAIIAKVCKGAKLLIIDDNVSWYQVQFKEKKVWIYSKLVKKI